MDAHLSALARTEPDAAGRLRPVAPGLWATPDEVLGGPAMTCGFLLQRPDGNVFVYSSNRIAEYFTHIDELGGVARVLLNHQDEATRFVTVLADHYNAPVHAHALEVEACTANGVASIESFDEDRTFGEDLEAFHLPGHTPGTTAYLWTNRADDRRYLFTGDTFTNFTVDNFPAVLGFHRYDGNVEAARASLRRLRDIESDVLVPGLANGTLHAYTWTEHERHTLVDYTLQQIADL